MLEEIKRKWKQEKEISKWGKKNPWILDETTFDLKNKDKTKWDWWKIINLIYITIFSLVCWFLIVKGIMWIFQQL